MPIRPSLFKAIIFLVFNSLFQNIICQDIAYSISNVFNFKKAVVSLTFDDGYVEHFTKVIPLLNSLNMQGTFYVISSSIDSTYSSYLNMAHNAHHEIGSHTITHRDLTKLNQDEIDTELYNSEIAINKTLSDNYACLSFCYPYSYYDKRSVKIASKYYMSARTLNIGYNNLNYFLPFNLRSKPYDYNTKIADLNNWVDKNLNSGTWLIEVYHRIDEYSRASIFLDSLYTHLKYLKSKEDDIWIAPVSNVIKYSKEALNTRIIPVLINDSVYEFRVDDYLNDSIYNHPISIKFFVPSDWQEVSVHRDFENLRDSVFNYKFNYSDGIVYMNIIPKGQSINIHAIKKNTKKEKQKFILIRYDPYIDKIEMFCELNDAESAQVRLIKLNGEIKNKIEAKNVNGGIYQFSMDVSAFEYGVYIFECIIKSDVGLYKEERKFYLKDH